MPYFDAPTVTNIEYTGAQTIAPNSADWPGGVTSLELGIRLSGGSWSTHSSGIASEETVVMFDLEPGTEYGVRWSGGGNDGDEALFTTLAGVPGSSGTLLTPDEETTPETPGPVTFDNLHASSVECAHLDPLPDRTEDFFLMFRKYTSGSIYAWAIAVTDPVEDTYYLVEGLDSDTDYEFKFQAENSHGVTSGPIARVITNASTDPGELVPDAPEPTVMACPEGKTEVELTLPAFVGTADTMYLQKATSLSGPWANYGAVHDTGSEEVTVTGLTANTTYYFRVVQYSGETEYVGSPLTYRTLPELPEAPGLPSVSAYNDEDNYFVVTLPTGISGESWLDLERGEGPTEDEITWDHHWERLAEGEEFYDVGLSDEIIYWYRAVAVNDCGVTYGEPISADTYSELPDAPPPIYLKEIHGSFVITRRTFDLPDRAVWILLRQDLIDHDDVFEGEDFTLTGLTPSSLHTLNYKACNHLGCTAGERVEVLTLSENIIPPPEIPSQPELGEITFSSIIIEGMLSLPEGALSVNLLYREINALSFIEVPYTPSDIVPVTGLSDDTLYEFKWQAVGETYSVTSNSVVVSTLIAPPEKPERPEV